MAGLPWIELSVDLPEHPKSLALAETLGDDNAWAYVVRLWTWCARNQHNGTFSGAHAIAQLERAAGWKGARGRLIAAAVEVGFLDQSADVIVVHGWAERAVAHMARRERDAERQKLHRAKVAERFGRRVTDSLVTRDTGVTNTGVTAESLGNKNSNSNKKKKEEEATEAPASGAPPQLFAVDPRSGGDRREDSPFVAFCRVAWPKVADPEALERDSREAYPGVDLLLEVKKARAWATANPRKAPRKDFARFLNSWFARAHGDRATNQSQAPPRPREVSHVDANGVVHYVGSQ